MFTDGSVEVTAEGIVSDDIKLSFVKMNHVRAAKNCRQPAATAEYCRAADPQSDWLSARIMRILLRL
jgi:hypothetical protein